jgi:hypothetical protein
MLTQKQMLQVWESGLERKPVERGVSMLCALHGSEPSEDPACLPIGSRDARLMALREQAFGSAMSAIASCPRCAESLECTFSLARFRAKADLAPSVPQIVEDGYTVDFRLPDSRDLLALQAGDEEPAASRRRLLNRCIVGANYLGTPVLPGNLPDWIVDEVAHAMGEADPQAEIELSLQCAACGNCWGELFDIESFLWSELDAMATRTLLEVHQLASAYGWNEDEILNLSPARRNVYLNLIAE